MKEGQFSYRDGWMFLRLEDGSVQISRDEDGKEKVVLVVDPDGWKSIITSVSKRGETAEAWQEAELFHNHK